MRNEPSWTRARISIARFFGIIIGSFSLSFFIIITIFYFIYVFYLWSDPKASLSDKSAVSGTFIGFLGILIAWYSLVSTTKQLNQAQKQLSDIQTDYWMTRGIDLYKKKEYRDADRSYKRAIDLNPDDTRVWINLASSLWEQNKLDEALNAINKAIEINPSRADSWNSKGMILRNKATNDLEQYIELNTELTEVRINKCVVPFAQPIVFFGNHMDDPNNETIGTWNSTGEVILVQALVALEKAKELKTIEMTHKPSEFAGDWLDKGFLAGVWSNIGIILYHQHKYNQAIDAYEKATERYPKYVEAWFNKGFAFISDERPNEAVTAFNKAIELEPKNAKSWYGKGFALTKVARRFPKEYTKNVYDEAIHAFDKAIEFDPLHHGAWLSKIKVLFDEGRYNEAIEACDKAIDISPLDLHTWHDKCVSLYKLSKYGETIAVSDILIKLSIQYALSWFNKYNNLNIARKYTDAIEAYDRGLELYTESAIYFRIKGDAICNLALWRPDGFNYALQAYNQAISLDPFDIFAWCGKCIALNALGYTDAAKDA
jgi:tetratricopeptide (TPR) repeat protein